MEFLGVCQSILLKLGRSLLLIPSHNAEGLVLKSACLSMFQLIPAMLTLFSGLKRAYVARAAAEDSDDDSDEDDSDDEIEVEELGSDEDDIDEEGAEYMEKLQKARQSMEAQENGVDEVGQKQVGGCSS
jgi:hypothetical protein